MIFTRFCPMMLAYFSQAPQERSRLPGHSAASDADLAGNSNKADSLWSATRTKCEASSFEPHGPPSRFTEPDAAKQNERPAAVLFRRYGCAPAMPGASPAVRACEEAVAQIV
jgi:hypothetical protein